MYQDSSCNPVNAMQLVDAALSGIHAAFAPPQYDYTVVDVESYNSLVRQYNDLVDMLVAQDNDARRCIALLQQQLRLARLQAGRQASEIEKLKQVGSLERGRSSLEIAMLRSKLAKASR